MQVTKDKTGQTWDEAKKESYQQWKMARESSPYKSAKEAAEGVSDSPMSSLFRCSQ